MTMPPKDMTSIDFLKDRATRNADDLAFRFVGNGELDGPITEWTFSELYHQVEKTSSGKPRRRHYQEFFLKGGLAVLHENRSPQTV